MKNKNKLKTISVGLTMAGCVMFTSSCVGFSHGVEPSAPIFPFMTQDGSADYTKAANQVNQELDKLDGDVTSLPKTVQIVVEKMQPVDFKKIYAKIALVNKETECKNTVAGLVQKGKKRASRNFEENKSPCGSMTELADKLKCHTGALNLHLQQLKAVYALGTVLQKVCTTREKPNKSTILPGVCRNDNVLFKYHCRTSRQSVQAAVDNAVVE